MPRADTHRILTLALVVFGALADAGCNLPGLTLPKTSTGAGAAAAGATGAGATAPTKPSEPKEDEKVTKKDDAGPPLPPEMPSELRAERERQARQAEAAVREGQAPDSATRAEARQAGPSAAELERVARETRLREANGVFDDPSSTPFARQRQADLAAAEYGIARVGRGSNPDSLVTRDQPAMTGSMCTEGFCPPGS